jgi:hypothetical protein
LSEYGVKIANFQAGSIWDTNLGVREKYHTTPAMLTNSLFLDYLQNNGLRVSKNGFTRDVICIQFDYGSDSYEQALTKLNKAVKKNRIERKRVKSHGHKEQIAKVEYTKREIARRKRELENNKDMFDRKSKTELREIFYVNGVDIKYPKFNKTGEVTGYDTIHYKMLYRTPGKAKKGTCMFIKSSLYKRAHNFLWMGLKLPKRNAPIVEIGAYSSLITSTIEGRVKIEPENILILKDVDSFFNTDVISIETDENKQCHAVLRENYKVKNVLFDGQALIDESIFPEWGNGYVLLRQHFFKAAAFHTKIQKYFKDYFGDNYETAKVTDMWGNEHYAKDIKLITTENAIKWIKFDVSYDYWCEKVWDNGAIFGIVKTAHKSKLGDVQRMSYQMVNSLDINTIDDVIAETREYIYKLKTDDETYFEFLRRNANFMNDCEVLLTLVEQNPDFVRSEYFVERRQQLIGNYVQRNVKQGRIIQNGDNLVIVGNPYGMLMHSVGENALDDPTFKHEDGCIQCWTARFDDGEYLAEFRSPFNSCNNLGYLHNHYHDYFDKYFNFGTQIIATNGINTPFQDRNNGSDADSDALYVTNQPLIVERAKYCYVNYPTVVNNIPMEKNIYSNELISFAKIDNNLAAAQLDIGESSNVAQIGLSYTYNDFGKKYDNYIAILAVLAQCAIDNAKRSYDVDVRSEIQRIKTEMNVRSIGYPAFFAGIRPDLRSKINPNIDCPMNHVYNIKNKRMPNTETIPMKEFFIPHENKLTKHKSYKIEKLIENYSLEIMNFNMEDPNDHSQYLLLRSDYDDLINELKRITMPEKYIGMMSWLINRALIITPNIKGKKDVIDTRLSKNRSILLKILYDINPKTFKKCFKIRLQ